MTDVAAEINDVTSGRREKKAAYLRAWRMANAERIKAESAACYASNREKVLARMRVYYVANREDVLAKVHAYRTANIEKVRAKDRARIDPLKRTKQRIRRERNDPTLPMIYSARKRAKVRGMEFNLTADDVKIPSHCPILGVALKRGVGRFADTSPTIDRIDNSRGYVPENVRVISHRANRLKSDATLDELRAFVSFYSKLDS